MVKTYYDPIMAGDEELTDKVTVYLIKSGNDKYAIKAINFTGTEQSLEKLDSDPTTRQDEYWPISTELILGLEGEPIYSGDKLTQELLTQDQVNQALGFDPMDPEIPPKVFGTQLLSPEEIIMRQTLQMIEDARIARQLQVQDRNARIIEQQRREDEEIRQALMALRNPALYDQEANERNLPASQNGYAALLNHFASIIPGEDSPERDQFLTEVEQIEAVRHNAVDFIRRFRIKADAIPTLTPASFLIGLNHSNACAHLLEDSADLLDARHHVLGMPTNLLGIIVNKIVQVEMLINRFRHESIVKVITQFCNSEAQLNDLLDNVERHLVPQSRPPVMRRGILNELQPSFFQPVRLITIAEIVAGFGLSFGHTGLMSQSDETYEFLLQYSRLPDRATEMNICFEDIIKVKDVRMIKIFTDNSELIGKWDKEGILPFTMLIKVPNASALNNILSNGSKIEGFINRYPAQSKPSWFSLSTEQLSEVYKISWALGEIIQSHAEKQQSTLLNQINTVLQYQLVDPTVRYNSASALFSTPKLPEDLVESIKTIQELLGKKGLQEGLPATEAARMVNELFANEYSGYWSRAIDRVLLKDLFENTRELLLSLYMHPQSTRSILDSTLVSPPCNPLPPNIGPSGLR